MHKINLTDVGNLPPRVPGYKCCEWRGKSLSQSAHSIVEYHVLKPGGLERLVANIHKLILNIYNLSLPIVFSLQQCRLN